MFETATGYTVQSIPRRNYVRGDIEAHGRLYPWFSCHSVDIVDLEPVKFVVVVDKETTKRSAQAKAFVTVRDGNRA